MAIWLVIMVYQNQCLGPGNCKTYSWLLTILMVLGMLVKIYYVNYLGMKPTDFQRMMNEPEKWENHQFKNNETFVGGPTHMDGYSTRNSPNNEENENENEYYEDEEDEEDDLFEEFSSSFTST